MRTKRKGRPCTGGPESPVSIESGNRKHRQHSAQLPAYAHCHRHSEENCHFCYLALNFLWIQLYQNNSARQVGDLSIFQSLTWLFKAFRRLRRLVLHMLDASLAPKAAKLASNTNFLRTAGGSEKSRREQTSIVTLPHSNYSY